MAESIRCAACQIPVALFAFSMAFQPIVDVELQRIDGYEALVRGPNEESAAATLAQVNDGNRYAFDQACRVRAIELAARFGMDRQLSINFLPNAVYEPRACIRATLEAAARTDFPVNRLTFEIVESEQIVDPNHLRRIVTEYQRQGFKVALDDFATCYSGLSRLAELKPDIVKLDRVLIQDCDQDPRRLAIVARMLQLAADLRIKVVVEGVERIGEVTALRAAGARYMQGFYFARPQFEALISDRAIFPASPALNSKPRVVQATYTNQPNP